MAKKKADKEVAHGLPGELAVRIEADGNSGDNYYVASDGGLYGAMGDEEGPKAIGVYKLVRVYPAVTRIINSGSPVHVT